MGPHQSNNIHIKHTENKAPKGKVYIEELFSFCFLLKTFSHYAISGGDDTRARREPKKKNE
jgi:hypothetical protein